MLRISVLGKDTSLAIDFSTFMENRRFDVFERSRLIFDTFWLFLIGKRHFQVSQKSDEKSAHLGHLLGPLFEASSQICQNPL